MRLLLESAVLVGVVAIVLHLVNRHQTLLDKINERFDEIDATLQDLQSSTIITSSSSSSAPVLAATLTTAKPKALVLGHQISATRYAHLEEVVLVLQRHGYDVTFELPQDSSSLNLIWTFEWPFYHQQLKQIYSTQMVNHFPNTGVLTSKVELATLKTGHIPISFRMPDEYKDWLNYTKSEQGASLKWLTKSNGHRGISLITGDPANFQPSGGSFVQHFIDDPLLIDDFKVDLGVYVLITSAVPLRVYVLDHEVWIRACPEPYHPFDPANTRKYVVDADHRPPWDLPSFAKFSEEGSTLKQAFTQYLTSRGYNAKILFDEVYAKIRAIFQLLGHQIASKQAGDLDDVWNDAGLNVDGASKHFDLMRFDFLIEIDKERKTNSNGLRPWLMEANFSPNLWAIKLPPNRRIYRQILYDIFSITGAAYNHQPGFFDKNLMEIGLVAENDLHIARPACNVDEECDYITDVKCKVCKKKWPSSFDNTLKQTSFEQLSRRHFRRIFPPEPERDQPLDGLTAWLDAIGYNNGGSQRTAADKALATWLYLKCQTEHRWCA